MTHLRSGTRKARKDHQCFGCCGAIKKSERYSYAVIVDGGEIYDTKLCVKCDYVAAVFMQGDAFCEGELVEDHRYVPGEYDAWLMWS